MCTSPSQKYSALTSNKLASGTYSLDVGLFTDKGLVCLDYAPLASLFEVRAEYFCEGLVHMDHEWTVIEE